jgi:hypothetical protein
VRLHGRNYQNWFSPKADVRARYDYLYRPEELEPWVAGIKKVAQDAEETYAVTNNHNLGKATVNGLQLEAFLSWRSGAGSSGANGALPGPPGDCESSRGRSSISWVALNQKLASSSRCFCSERIGYPRAPLGNTRPNWMVFEPVCSKNSISLKTRGIVRLVAKPPCRR